MAQTTRLTHIDKRTDLCAAQPDRGIPFRRLQIPDLIKERFGAERGRLLANPNERSDPD
jgi:hypothetical protein